jgi:hypothetical protein
MQMARNKRAQNRLESIRNGTWDYGPEIKARIQQYYRTYPTCQKLPDALLLEIIKAANERSNWKIDPYNNKWEVNGEAGQIRRSIDSTKTRLPGELISYIKGFYYWTQGDGPRLPRGRVILRAYQRDRNDDKETVDHINPAFNYDDRLSNLQWLTVKQQNEKRRVPKKYGLSNSRKFTPEEISKEKWLPLSEYGRLKLKSGYEISSLGRFKNLKGKVTSGSLQQSTGYLRVGCLVEGFGRKPFQVLVHSAACLAFRGPKPSDKHTVDHNDRNRTNNCIENLDWKTAIEQNNNRKTFDIEYRKQFSF